MEGRYPDTLCRGSTRCIALQIESLVRGGLHGFKGVFRGLGHEERSTKFSYIMAPGPRRHVTPALATESFFISCSCPKMKIPSFCPFTPCATTGHTLFMTHARYE